MIWRKGLAGELGADIGGDEGDHLVDAHIGGVDEQGIVCLLEGGAGALGVLAVALGNGIGDAFGSAAGGAHFLRGGHEVLVLGVGEDDGADIAAFHDHGLAGVVFALLFHEQGAHSGDGGDGGDVVIRALFGKLGGENATFVYHGGVGAILAEAQRDAGQQRLYSGGVSGVHALLQGVPGHGAVHGTCVDESVTKLFCNEFGHGGFTGSCRTVDSDGRRIHTAGIIPVIPRGVEKKRSRCRELLPFGVGGPVRGVLLLTFDFGPHVEGGGEGDDTQQGDDAEPAGEAGGAFAHIAHSLTIVVDCCAVHNNGYAYQRFSVDV